MEVAYCYNCGCQISLDKIAPDAAKRTEDGRFYCAKCAPLFEHTSSALMNIPVPTANPIDDKSTAVGAPALKGPLPVVSKFWFCEKCGARLTNVDVEQGRARDKKLKGVYCQACSEGVFTLEMLAVTDEQIKSTGPARKRKSSHNVIPAAKGAAESHHHPVRKRNGSNSNYVVAIGIVMAACALLFMTFRMATRPTTGQRGKTTVSATAAPAPELPSPDPVRESLQPADSKTATPRTISPEVQTPPAPKPVAIATPVAPTPATPAPASPPLPAPSSPAAPENTEKPSLATKEPAADRSRLDACLDRFDAEALHGRFAEAKQIAQAASADASLTAFAAEVRALTDVGNALTGADDTRLKSLQALSDGKSHTIATSRGPVTGVVQKVSANEIRIRTEIHDGGAVAAGELAIKLADLSKMERERLTGQYAPSTPSEHLAQAIHALAERDATQAKLELAAAKDQLLAGRYAGKANELEVSLQDEKAKKAWELLAIPATAPPSAPAAENQLKKLADFEKSFGQTKFALSIAARINEAKSQAQTALGRVSGILIGVPNTWEYVDIKADDEGRPTTRYYYNTPLKNGAATNPVVDNRVIVQWKEENGRKQIVSLSMVVPEIKSGVAVGKVIDKMTGANNYIELKLESGEIERFTPPFLKDPPGLDAKIVEAIATHKIGDSVKIEWFYENRRRARKIE